MTCFLFYSYRWSVGTYLLKKDTNQEDEIVVEHPLPVFHNESDVQQNHSERTPLIFKSIEKKGVNIGVRILNFFRRVIKPIKEIMNPPLYAALLALIIGTIPFLKGIFFGMDAPLYAL